MTVCHLYIHKLSVIMWSILNTLNHFFIGLNKPACKYCNGMNHKMKDCPEYRIDTDACSKDDYYIKGGRFNEDVRKNDLKGFRAAGHLAHTINKDGRIYVLMIMEKREGKCLYNFIGGKRDSKDETPVKTSVREAKEELKDVKTIKGKLTSEDTYQKRIFVSTGTFWIAKSKYFLFGVRNQQAEDVNFDINDTGSFVDWVPISLLSNNAVVHRWCIDVVESFNLDSSDCCIY